MRSGVDQPKTSRSPDAHIWHARLARARSPKLVRPVHRFSPSNAHGVTQKSAVRKPRPPLPRLIGNLRRSASRGIVWTTSLPRQALSVWWRWRGILEAPAAHDSKERDEAAHGHAVTRQREMRGGTPPQVGSPSGISRLVMTKCRSCDPEPESRPMVQPEAANSPRFCISSSRLSLRMGLIR